MDLNTLYKHTGDFVRIIQDAKILNLKDGELLDSFINGGKIPVFFNGAGTLSQTVKKLANGEDYVARRPYLVCYNKSLGCRVMYPMTASQTKEIIRDKERYQFIETPTWIYTFIESAVNHKFESETHTEDSISTVNVRNGIPVFGDMLDYSSVINPIDYSTADFKSSEVYNVRAFLENFYGGRYEQALTKEVQGAKDKSFAVVKTEKPSGDYEYTHQTCRPSVIYMALFMNWAKQVVQEHRIKNPSQLSSMKPIYLLTASTYIKYLQYTRKVEEFKKSHRKVFNMYMEARTFSFGRPTRQEFIADVEDKLSHYNFGKKMETKVRELLNAETEVEKDIKIASGAIMNYINSLPIKVDMSAAHFDPEIFNALEEMSSHEDPEPILWVWGTNDLSFIDQEIMRITRENARIKEQRETEAENRRKERQRREQAQKTKAELVRGNVQEAIMLYTGMYRPYFKRIQEGGLAISGIEEYADNFIELFSSYNDGDNSLRDMLENDDQSPIEERINSAILNLTKFVPVVSEAKELIEGNTHAKAFENFVAGKTKEIVGESDSTTRNTLELLNLVHTELDKARHVSKGKNEKESYAEAAVSNIIQKALRQKDKFADVDLSPESKVRSVYMEEVAEVQEGTDRIIQLCAILKLHKTALGAIRHARNAYVALYMTANAVVDSYGDEWKKLVEHLIAPTEEFGVVIEKVEQSIYRLLTSNDIDLVSTDKKIEEYAATLIGACAERQEMMVGINHAFGHIQKFISRYEQKLADLKAAAPIIVSKAKEKLGVDQSFGILDGKEIVGNKHREVENAVTSQVESRSEADSKLITDEDLVEVMLNRGMIQLSSYVKKVFNAMKDANTMDELNNKLFLLASETDKWEKLLESDYVHIESTYEELLKVFVMLENHPDKMIEYREKFLGEFSPVFANGNRLIGSEATNLLQILSKKSNRDMYERDKKFVEMFTDLMARSLTSYVVSLDSRRNPEEPIANKLGFEVLMKKTEHITNYKKKYCLAKTKKEFETMYAKLDRLTQEEVNRDLAGLLQDPLMQKAFSHHVLPLLFEIQHEVMLASAYEGTMYAEAESKMDLIAELFESEGICSMLADCLANGVSVMNSVYEYVLDGVQRLREYRKKVMAKNYEKIADRVSIPATYDVLYKNWILRLHHIEESRKEMGEYVLEEGRDIEKEKKVYENGLIDDADLISLLNLFD